MNNHFDTLALLESVPLFQGLGVDVLSALLRKVTTKTFVSGAKVYAPFEVANALYIIKKGKIRIYRLAENGKEQLIRLVIAGEFTGELALFKEGIYEAFAESLSETEIIMISHHDFKEILRMYPQVSLKMLETLTKRLSVSEEQTAWVATETVRDRLLHFLSRLAINKEVKLEMSKKDLASYLGTTPESLSREWTKLENEQLIEEKVKNIIRIKFN